MTALSRSWNPRTMLLYLHCMHACWLRISRSYVRGTGWKLRTLSSFFFSEKIETIMSNLTTTYIYFHMYIWSLFSFINTTNIHSFATALRTQDWEQYVLISFAKLFKFKSTRMHASMDHDCMQRETCMADRTIQSWCTSITVRSRAPTHTINQLVVIN